ncbi:retrovirus-related pol polyprotein from transposon TNT 1-94 [Tanacetum coccineum]
MIKSTKNMLKLKFDMKDMDLADVILRIKIIRTHNGLVLSQAHCVDKILNTHNAGDSGLARTPIDTSTRPDLSYAISRLSRLHYDRYPAVIEGYSDANWIFDIKDSRSTSGYVFTLGGATISWKSSKQTVIAKSTMESKFIAAHSIMFNEKYRHIHRRHNSIRQLLSTRVILIDYVKSKDNIADPLMKGLSRELVIALRSPSRELRNELKCVQNGVNMNEISCLKVRMAIDTNVTAPVTSPVNVTGASVTNKVAYHAEKPKKFNGQNFKRWQQKMFFYLTTLNLARFLNETAPQVEPHTEGQPSNAQTVQAVEAWKHSDFLCHNYVLNGLVDSLYNVYCKTTTAKELWESLERKYKTEDAGTNKFVVARFLDYNMVDSKNVITQVQDLQVLLHNIHTEGMPHNRKEMSVEDLIVCLRIEKDNKMAQKNTYAPDSAKANMVEHDGSSSKSNSKAKGKGKKKNDKKGKGKAEYLAPKAGIVKQKFQGTCYNCDQPVNLVGSNNSVCADKSMFHSFKAVDNGEKLYMDNSATGYIKGEGDVILKMTSEKELKLTNVFKDEAIDKFVLHKTEVEYQLGRKIKVVRSDRGGEYVSPFADLCAKHGIRHEFTSPYSPQQNGIAERKNSTLKEMVNAMLISSGLSQDMWGEAILTATYLLNKIPCKEKEETPYELWPSKDSGPKSMDCIFIGYAKNSSAYRFIIHDSKNSDIQKNAVMESRNASFFENIFPCLTKETGSSSRLDEEVVQDKRQRDDNDLHDERQDQLEEEEKMNPCLTDEGGYFLGRASMERSIKSEIDSILQNHTWELVDLPPGCKPLGYKWIFKKKMKADGTIDKYKARLVIKGYRQHMLIIGSNDKMIKSTKDMLKSKFDMKDMGLADNSPIDISTRPDLAYAVSRLSRYPVVIEGYSDENWISNIKDSRSISGYVFTLGGGPRISWKSSKQTDLLVHDGSSKNLSLLDKCGRRGGIGYLHSAHSTMYNGKYRHIRRRHNSIRQLLSTRVISIDYVKSKDNIADLLTKGLSRELVSQPSNAQAVQAVEAWKHSDFLCHNYVLNGLVDSLYNVYCKTMTAKDFWESLVRKYKTEDASTKKFVAKGKGKKKNDKKGKGKAEYLLLKLELSNMVIDNVDMIAMVSDIIAMISKVNLVGYNNSVCADKKRAQVDTVCRVLRDSHESLCVRLVGGKNQGGMKVIKEAKRYCQKEEPYLEKMVNAILISSGLSQASSRLDDEVVQDKRPRDEMIIHMTRGLNQIEEEGENEPTSYREAVTSLEGHHWKEAIKSEIDSILQNHTWELVDLPPGCTPLGYKWIFKKKMKADGTIDKYKARLVIKGYRQREGLDYFDNYLPVKRITSIRMVLAITALRNLEVHQMDVKTAFLNGDLEEEIYMNQPEGFIAPGQESKVYRLVKSLYGLKQAPKQWHQKFDHTMLESRFKINECDKCVYVKDTSSGYVIFCLYVDDMLIIDSNDKMIKSTKDMWKSKFDMKDMGLADVILGIKVIQTHNGLVLSQAHYVYKILNTHNVGDSGLARTPSDTSTRPDLSYIVSRLSRYTNKPSVAHWKAMTRIFDIKDSRSTSGYVFTLGGAAISWKSSKQTVIAKSMMESEFIALDKCGEEAEWLRQFVDDIPRLLMLPRLRARAGGCRKWDFWAKMGSKLLNSCEPARPADTNAAPKARLRAYLFAADFVFS